MKCKWIPYLFSKFYSKHLDDKWKMKQSQIKWSKFAVSKGINRRKKETGKKRREVKKEKGKKCTKRKREKEGVNGKKGIKKWKGTLNLYFILQQVKKDKSKSGNKNKVKGDTRRKHT